MNYAAPLASHPVEDMARGPRQTLKPGERIAFDLTMMDAAPAPSALFVNDALPRHVGPAAKRQREITADAQRTAAARRFVNDFEVGKAMAATQAERASGRSDPTVATLRDARSQGEAIPALAAGKAVPVADNSHVAAALRSARYI